MVITYYILYTCYKIGVYLFITLTKLFKILTIQNLAALVLFHKRRIRLYDNHNSH